MLGLVGGLAACSGLVEPAAPAELQMPAGTREWRISVENASAAPVLLFVAEDAQRMGSIVGTATPNTVPPRTTQEVIFRVPPGEGWAIFVNPTPEVGPLILERDVPKGVRGALPFTISVAADGMIGAVGVPNAPGWFGN